MGSIFGAFHNRALALVARPINECRERHYREELFDGPSMFLSCRTRLELGILWSVLIAELPKL